MMMSNLNYAKEIFSWTDVKAAQANVDDSQDYVDYCLEKLVKYIPPNSDGTYPDVMTYILDTSTPKLPGYETWQPRPSRWESGV